MQENLDPRSLLRNEFQRRLSSRPRYSLRAFARALKVSPATLSLILAGKSEVSKKVIQKMTDNLDLTNQQLQALKSSPPQIDADRDEVQMITWDVFTIFSEWYYFAILSLLEVKGAQLEGTWLSKKLGITVSEATEAIHRLKRVGIIEKTEGQWKQTGGHLRVPPHLSTSASRKFQKQLLQKAIDSLEHDAPETRDMTAMTFAMDPSLLKFASDKITEFRRALTNELEKKKSPKAVYNLTIQLFPVSKENS